MANPPVASCGALKRFRTALFALCAFVSSLSFAAPVPIERVRELAGGIASSVQVSSAGGAAVSIAQAVSPVEVAVVAVAPTNTDETAFFVIDRGSTGGFVVMSADDRLNPVLVIAPSGRFDSTPGTPLYDLLCKDVQSRVAAADAGGSGRSEGWAALLNESDPSLMKIAYSGISSINDVRVEPFVQSKWSQSTVDGKNVYNYYTPYNYVCGCVATAGAQILRYYEYPEGSVTPVSRTCTVDGVSVTKKMYGGDYPWEDMPFVPDSSITDKQRQAIGKLCYDVGVAVRMSWTQNNSGAYITALKEALTDVFGYQNAIVLISNVTLPDDVVKNALLANLDAKYPVELGITGAGGGHAIVGDGYGYSNGKLFMHLNLGWGGSSDAWYNLPDIGTAYSFNVVDSAIYNIFPDHTGSLLSGRVLDSIDGTPIANATVKALDGSSIVGTTKTDAKGIYAFCLPGNEEYSIVASASGAESQTKMVYLTESESTRYEGNRFWHGSGVTGNSWGNDFALVFSSDSSAPEAPVGVVATEGTSTAGIRINWSASSGATGYKVYRATSNSSSAAKVIAASLTSLYYDDTSVEVGTTYYYWVKAVNSFGESDFSSFASGWRAYAIPNAPTGVSASDGTSTTGVVITWDGVDDADTYSVWRSTSSASSTAVSIGSSITATSYTDTSAVAGTTYYYWVKATNRGGTSAFSVCDSGYRAIAAPSAPTGVTASDGLSSSEIIVSWNPVSSAKSYSVWRSTSSSSSSASQIASGLTVTSYSDTSAVAGTTYHYWVKATNQGGTSAFSSSDTGYLAVITGPSSVSASDGAYSSYVRVSWTASQNASSYEVWRGTANAYSLASKITTTTAVYCNDSSAQPGLLYYYWVRAVTAAGTSAFSSSDSGYRPLSVPAGVKATTGDSAGVTVSWSSVTGAGSYQVGRAEEGASSPSTVLGTSTSLSYIDASAVPGVTYAYFVRAVSSACTGGWSSGANGSRSIPVPADLTASDGTYSDRILVSWPSLSGALRYELMRSEINDISSAETIATVTGTTYFDTSADYGLTYYYFLRAVFSAGTSRWSESEAGWRAFPVPAGVSASDGDSTSKIVIGWDEIEGAVLFQIWRYSSECGRNELIGTSTSTSFSDSKNIEPGVKYTYRIKAVFATGLSEFSIPDAGYLKASAPSLSATDGTSLEAVTISWEAAARAVRYQIWRGTSSKTSEAEMIGTTGSLRWVDQEALSGTMYYYWVKSVTSIDTSDFGSSDTGYIGLPGVTSVSATDGLYADKIAVSWSAVAGADTYEIWRGASSDFNDAKRVKKGVSDLYWEDSDADPGARHWYWVKACDVGPGLWGASDSGYRTLAVPTQVTATTNDTDGVKISWKGTTSGVSFEILRSMTDDIDQAYVVATVAEKSNYTDNTTVPGYVYHYWVRAYSALSESAWSASVSGFRAVAAPEDISATDGTSLTDITVTWTKSTSAVSYEIWRATTTKSSSAELIGTTNKLIWVDSEVEAGVTYYYWIKSVSALDTSDFSDRDAGYVSAAAPSGVTASDGISPASVTVSWEKSEGALAYSVWRAESADVETAEEIEDEVTSDVYEDTSITPGKYYWYWVRPVSEAGPGVFAGPDSGFAALSAPSDILATSNSETRVTVSWKRPKGAVWFEVFRAQTNDIAYATNEVLATVTTLSYADTNAFPAVRYWYWVRAVAEADVSPFGGPADGFRLLAKPEDVSASDGEFTQFVKVSWSETTGAESYEVWRAENSTYTSQASLIACVTNSLEYSDASALPGISYTYWIKAVSEFHTTGFSDRDKGWRSPLPPSSVTASDGTSSEGIIVDWSAVDGAVKYEVWRFEGDVASAEGASRVFTSSDASTCVYTNTSASAGVKYWFWVRTVCSAGTGVFGVPDEGYRAVSSPEKLKATDGSSYDYVRVTWGSVSGASSYEVLRSPTNEIYGAEKEYFTVSGTTFDDTNAVPGIVYNYSVRTLSPMSTSDFAGPDTGYRKLQKITDVAASDGTSLDAVEISWTKAEGAVKYKVWRSASTGISSANAIATVEGNTYSDTSALHGEKYYYWVNAVSDVEGETGPYNDGWRGLVAPVAVTATDGDSTSHTRITWSSSPDATVYEILRGSSADPASMTVIKSLSATPELVWEDSSGTAGALYYYSVRAGGTGGWSEPGAVDSGYKALSASSSISATDGSHSGKVVVNWNAVAGAGYYRVYRADSESGEKTPWSDWQAETTFSDMSCRGGVRYWYYVVAAVDESGSRPSAFSAGDSGYAKDDGAGADPVELGGGISWPVLDNGDGTTTTNALSYTSVEGGRLAFTGVYGAVGSVTTVQVMVKTSLSSDKVYTLAAPLEVVSSGTAELDLSAVWGRRTSLFVVGISTEEGEALPE